MSDPTNRAGRVDLLLHGLCETFVRQALQPHMAIDLDLWNDCGLSGVAARGIAGLGVPQGQIEYVQVGQLRIPMRLVENFGRAVLAKPEAKRVR